MLLKNVQGKSAPGSYWNLLKTSDVGDPMMQHFPFRTFSLHVTQSLFVGRAAHTTLGIQVSMERDLAAFPAWRCRVWSGAARRKGSICAQLSLPEGGLGLSVLFGPSQDCQSAILGFMPCFDEMFCRSFGKSLPCLLPPQRYRHQPERARLAVSWRCCCRALYSH